MRKILLLLALFALGFPAFAGAPAIPPGTYVPYPTYIGQHSTRTFLPNTINSGGPKQTMSRTLHYARDNITALAISVPNWYVSAATAELGSGGTLTATASVEYPIGTMTKITFAGGSTTGTASDLTNLYSDSIPITIPRGALYFIRLWTSNTVGIVFNASQQGLDITGGEAFTFGTTVTDQTLSGSVTSTTSTANTMGPSAIYGPTTRPSIFLAGDSRTGGIGDSMSDGSDDVGDLARGVGPYYAYINAGISGDRLSLASVTANYTNRLALSQFCSHIIVNLGVNDIYNGATLAQVQALQQTFYGLFAGKPIIQATIGPETASSDSWTSVSGQSPTNSTYEAVRVSVNSAIRGGLPLTIGFIDSANQIENIQNNGLYPATNTVSISSGSYTSGSGAVSLTTSAAHNMLPGTPFIIKNMTGTGSFSSLNGYYVATTGTTGTTLNYTAATGLTLTITGGAVNPWTADGIHPSMWGYMAIKQAAMPQIRALIGGKP